MIKTFFAYHFLTVFHLFQIMEEKRILSPECFWDVGKGGKCYDKKSCIIVYVERYYLFLF